MKNLRLIIREQLSVLFENAPIDGGVLDDAMTDIQTQITNNIENLDGIEKATDQDIKNKEFTLKANKQLKGQLPATNADKQGLERSIPTKQKEIDLQKKQALDIVKAKQAFAKTQDELKKQELLAKQTTGEKTTQPVLKSLESPI